MAEKKQPKTKYQIKRRTPFDDNLLPVIQNLSAEGRSLADIGMMLGYAGKSPAQWLRLIKNKHPEVADALKIGAMMADTKLVVTAFDTATGYDIEELDIEYKAVPRGDTTGITGVQYIETNRKTKRKHIRPDTSLLFKLLCNRLPEYFSDTRKFEVNKRSVNVKIDMDKEISAMAGKLMDVAEKRKIVKSKEVNEQI